MAQNASKKNFVGIDLGGTNIKVGVLNDAGETLTRLSIPTLVEKGADEPRNVWRKPSTPLLKTRGSLPTTPRR